MKNILKYLLVLAVCSSLFSCKNDLQVNAPWKESMIVYGLLNPHDSVQYLRINKAFLGPGNEMSYAKIADSINYPAGVLTILLQKYTNGTAVGAPIHLIRDNSMPKDPGTFANDSNVLYKTPVNTVIDQNSQYVLTVKNSESGNTVTSQTSIVHDILPITPNRNNATINWIQSTPIRVKWYTAQNGKVYNLVIRIHYDEMLPSTGTFVPKTLDWSFGNMQSLDTLGYNLNPGEALEQDISGDEFYLFLANRLQPIPGGSRHLDSLDYIWTVGSMDLNTYIQVYQPSIGIVQEKPEFTNINGGIGIFSSRNTYMLHGMMLSQLSKDSLMSGPITGHLGFQ